MPISEAAQRSYGRYEMAKRMVDVIFALMLLVLLAPCLLVTMIAVKLDGPGPIFFRQRRLGKHGTIFEYVKFRTMSVDASESATGPAFALRQDSRITRVGRFLRMTSIDELPTLFNVLRGDMSLVGPRAGLPLEIAHYSERARERLQVKPGITGLWQVFGRSSMEFNQMIELDLEYVKKRSLALDMKILLRTVVVALKKDAGY